MKLANIPRRIGQALDGNAFWWRWVTNLGPTLDWRRTARPLSEVQQRVLGELRRDGIAFTSVAELLPNPGAWDELQEAVEAKERELEPEIRAARGNIDKPGHKAYLIQLLGGRPALDSTSIFVRFSLLQETLGLANAYFGMFTRLWMFNIWHNLATNLEAKESQLWHRDPEDRQILRMFVYLRDVGPGSGPLSFIPGSHELGNRQIRPEQFLEGGKTPRSSDEQMIRVAPKETWRIATGPRGTIVFVDTRGYHKGGHVRESDRITYNSMWTSRAVRRPRNFSRSLPIPPQSDPALAYALGCGPRGAPASADVAVKDEAY